LVLGLLLWIFYLLLLLQYPLYLRLILLVWALLWIHIAPLSVSLRGQLLPHLSLRPCLKHILLSRGRVVHHKLSLSTLYNIFITHW
jgi:hypothetical protein